MRRALVLASSWVLIAISACTSDVESVREDGKPRLPDDAGIVTAITLEEVELDGERSYPIHPRVESFKTRSKDFTALLAWADRYVHLGLDDGEVVRWIVGIGLVAGDPPIVRYSGVFESFDTSTRQATFEDGTVLEFDRGVKPAREGREIVVEIDAHRDLVVKVLT